MKLYYSPGACSLAPHIVLREAGLDFELEKVDLKAKKTASGADYLAVTGKGYVPALQLDDGQVLTEVPAIVQYLADRKPEAGLAPATASFERYRLQEWLNYISTEIHKTLGSLFKPTTPDDYKPVVIELAEKRLAWIESDIRNRSYLMGERFSVADAYLFTLLRWTAAFKIDLGKYPALKDYFARVGARPKVHEALLAEGLKRR